MAHHQSQRNKAHGTGNAPGPGVGVASTIRGIVSSEHACGFTVQFSYVVPLVSVFPIDTVGPISAINHDSNVPWVVFMILLQTKNCETKQAARPRSHKKDYLWAMPRTNGLHHSTLLLLCASKPIIIHKSTPPPLKSSVTRFTQKTVRGSTTSL